MLFAFFSFVSCSDKQIFENQGKNYAIGSLVVTGEVSGSGAKALSVNDTVEIVCYQYKAVPDFGEEGEKIPGLQSEYKAYEPGNNLSLAVGNWHIWLCALDKNGNMLFEGSTGCEVVRSQNRLNIRLSKVRQDGKGVIRIILYDMKDSDCVNGGDDYKITYFDMQTRTANTENIEFSGYDPSAKSLESDVYMYGGKYDLEVPVGTYILTVFKNYYETLNGKSQEKQKGITQIVNVYKGNVSTVEGNVGKFRDLGTFRLNLPTIAENAQVQAYDGYSYVEVKANCTYNGTFLSEYLDGKRYEDALYDSAEDCDVSAVMENVGVLSVGSEPQWYAHRKSYSLAWDYSEATTYRTVGMTPAGTYKWNTNITAPAVAKTGYDFTAWNPSFSGKMPAENVIYKPVFIAKTITVTFNYNGATGGNSVISKDVVYDQAYGDLPEPIKKGYTFLGWTLVE